MYLYDIFLKRLTLSLKFINKKLTRDQGTCALSVKLSTLKTIKYIMIFLCSLQISVTF